MKSNNPKDTQPEVYQKLVETIAENEAIAMVGAGSSKWVGYPSFDELLGILSDQAVKIDSSQKDSLNSLRKSDKLICADQIKKILGSNTFYNQLANIFGPPNPKYDAFHQLIVGLPFKHFLTTNYDRILQVAHDSCRKEQYIELDLEDHQRIGNLFDLISERDAQRYFVHVHGSIRNPQNILLANEDYNKRYIKRNDFTDILKLFFTRRLVFIGFSLGDEEFMRPLKYLTACLGGEGDARHFAILPQPDSQGETSALQTKCRSTYRIEPFFYDKKNNHASLKPFLEKLTKDVEEHSKKVLTREVSNIMDLAGGSPEISVIVQPIQKVKDLVKVSVGSNQFDTTSPDAQIRTKLDSEIDSIFSYVKNKRPEIAIELYKSILEREGEGLNKRLKYRLHANIGNALNSMNKPKEAAEEYRIATDYWMETKDALALRALGHILNREFPKSLEITEKVCKEYPDFPRGHSLRLQSMPRSYPFKDARKSVPLKIRRNPEVALVLSRIAQKQGLRKRSEVYSRIAWKGAPDWIEAELSYATEILITEKEKAVISGSTKYIPQNIGRLKEAESILTGLLVKLEEFDPAKIKGIIFFNRSSIRRFLGLESEARSDTEQAFHYDSNDPETIAAYVLQRERDVGYNEAIRILDDYEGTNSHPILSFLLSNMLFQRSGQGDLDRALSLLMPWCEKIENINPISRRYEFLRLISSLLRKLDRTKDAVSLVNNITEPSLPSSYKQLLLLWIQIESNTIDLDKAKQICESISDFLSSGDDYFITREIALCAHNIKYYPLSFVLWRKITYPHDCNLDTQYLFAAAKEIKEFKFIIDWCTHLRQNNIYERNCYIYEIGANIECHEFNEALNLMVEWLKYNPNDKEMRMNLSLLASQIGKEQYVESDPDKLPAIENVPSVEYGNRVIQSLNQVGKIDAAMVCAYDLWRKFPDDMVARHTLITMVINNQNETILKNPEAVVLGSAIIYKAADTGESRIHIIEEGNSPSMARNEYSPNHEISKLLLGKKVGDSIPIYGRGWTVLEIHNKYGYTASVLLKDFDMDFPGNPLLRQFQVPDKPDVPFDPQVALGDIKPYMQVEETRKKTFEELYQKGSLPVVTFAKFMSKSVLETMIYLATSLNHNIKVCLGVDDAYNVALQKFSEGCQVVLDETAIATLFMLGLHKDLRRLPYKLIIPESLLFELRKVIKIAIFNRSSELYLGISNGKIVVQKVSPTEHAKWINSLEELLASLNEKNCTIEGGRALLNFEATTRQNLIQSLGPVTADAIAIAKKNEALYWTDDLLSGQIASALNISRVWSQVALQNIKNKDKGFISTYNKAEKNLFLWGYEFTAVHIRSIISILIDTRWNLKDSRSKHVEEFVERVGAANKSNCITTCLLVITIWQMAPKRKIACEIIIKLLEKIGRDVSGPKIARVIYRGQFKAFKSSRIPKLKSLKHMLRSWRMNSLKLD